MKKLVIALVAGLGVSAGCAKKQPLPDVVEVPAQSFSRAWTSDLRTAHDPLDRIYVRDEMIFAVTHSREVFVMDRSGGTLKFAEKVGPTGSQVLAPVILADRIVYPTTANLEIFDKKSGAKVREIDVGSPLHSGAVGSGHMVYVGTDSQHGGRVVALDIDKPYSPVVWELLTFGGLSSTPVLSQGVLYVGSEDGNVFAVTEDRVGVWPDLPGGVFATGSRIEGDLAADDKFVYVPCMDSKMYVLDKKTGKIEWQFFAGSPLSSGPIVTNDLVYLNVPNQGVVCVDKAGGEYNRKARWKVEEATNYLAEDEKYTYVRLRGNILAAVDKQNGQIMFRSKRSDLDIFGVNRKDNIIYAATRDGAVMAIKPVLKPGTVGELVMEKIEMPHRG